MNNKLLDNRLINKFIIIFPIINLFRAVVRLQKEINILKGIINENHEFFVALATLGFEARGRVGQLVSTMPHDNMTPPEERLAIINKTIINVIMKFVNDENLLGIIYIDCVQNAQTVIVSINPVSLKLVKIDIIDLAYSLGITSGLATLAYIFI